MIYLGVDPGYRNLGLCFAQHQDDEWKILKRTTLNNGALKDWQKGIPSLIDGIKKFLTPIEWEEVDGAGVEMISWYGKRRGSLQLAHLAGACYGALHAWKIKTQFFAPKEVKMKSAALNTPKLNEHEQDAFSLCQLLVTETASAPKSRK